MSTRTYDGPVSYMPSRRDLGPLQAALFLAALLHMVGLLVLCVVISGKDSGEGFFSSLQEPVKLREVDLVQVKPEPKATTPPPRPTPTPTSPQVATTPRVPSVAPGPRGPKARPQQPGGGRPKVVASNSGRWSVPSGEGYNGTGPGVGGGPGGPGRGWGGGDGPGGPGTSGGPSPALAPPASGEFTNAALMYFPFFECKLPDPGQEYTRDMRHVASWDAFCQWLQYPQDELKKRPHVKPFLLGHTKPRLDAMEALRGKQGEITVRTTVFKDGTQKSEIVTGSGDAAMDRVGYAVAVSTAWLPALDYGTPVQEAVEYRIQFGTYAQEPRQAVTPGSAGNAGRHPWER